MMLEFSRGGLFDPIGGLWYRSKVSKVRQSKRFLDVRRSGGQVKHMRLGLLLALWMTWGCGPIYSGVQILKASVELTAAETAGAKKHAIYEYTAAGEYLHKSREEHGYSDFAKSLDYADRAVELAKQARQRAEAKSQLDQPAELPPQ